MRVSVTSSLIIASLAVSTGAFAPVSKPAFTRVPASEVKSSTAIEAAPTMFIF